MFAGGRQVAWNGLIWTLVYAKDSLPELNSTPIETLRNDSFRHVPITVRMNAAIPSIIPVMRNPRTVFSRFVPECWKNRMYLISPDNQFCTNNVSVFDTNNTILLKVNISVKCNYVQKVLGHFCVLLQFPITKKEAKIDYRHQELYIPVATWFQNNLMLKILAK